ncbi:MAG: hypothetical protein OEM91_08820, partial [Hyphomicrobiales bacterium]|nr:hypothetical protein [Hyphomicrobiales bacterium]
MKLSLLRHTYIVFAWASAFLTVSAILPGSQALSGQDKKGHAHDGQLILAQLSTRGSTTNSQIPTGPGTGGPSSYGAKQPGGVTPKPGRTRSIGPSTRTPTTSGPVNKRFTIDKNRLKPEADTSAKKTQSATKRKPAKSNKKQAARPKRPPNNRTAAPAAIPVPPFFPNRAVVL